MDPALIITVVASAVVAIFASVTAPLILAARTDRLHREDRAADWARQDALAAAARTAVQEATEHTNGKLDVIHELVNSNMTAAMQSELDAVRRELAMMREVIALNQAAGREPDAETLAAVRATEAKITELAATLADRDAAARRAEHLAPPAGGDDP